MRTHETIVTILVLGATGAGAFEYLGPKWPGIGPVVEYYINEHGCDDVSDEWDHIHRSFTVWSDVPTTAIACDYRGETSTRDIAADDHNVVMWLEGEDWNLDDNVIGACYYWYQSNTMVDFDIAFNAENFTWSTDGSAGTMDVGHIATHEVGHALGLGHSDVRDAVMWPTAAYGDTAHRHLHSDDSAGISALYPRTSANNHPPVVTSEAITEAIVGTAYRYQVCAEDPDGDPVRYSLSHNPLTMTIDSITGRIVWHPAFLDAGSHRVVVEVRDPMNAVGRQAFAVTVSNLVVFTDDTTLTMGDTAWFPVYVSAMDEHGVLAGTVELTFDETRMAVLGVDTAGSVLAGATLARNITGGTVSVAFAAAEPLAGEGVLFRMKVTPAGDRCGMGVQIPLTRVAFNDGTPTAGRRDGEIFLQCGGAFAYDIGGSVSLTGNGAGVGGVVVTLDELGLVDTTTGDGAFRFEKVPQSSTPYTITTEKERGDLRDGISAYDASLILRSMVGLHDLGDFLNQTSAADVNGNDMLTALDAALILRFLVGYDDETAIGEWVLDPATLTLDRHMGPRTGLEAGACLIGDVSGNWSRSDDGMPKRLAARGATVYMRDFESTAVTDGDETLPAYTTVIGLEDSPPGVYAGEITMRVDGARYRLEAIRPRELLGGYTSAGKQTGDQIRIAFAGTEPLAATGELYEVVLTAVDGSGADGTELAEATITRVLHNEYAMSTRVVRRTTGGPKGTPAVATGIERIRSDRFTTDIAFGLAAKMPVRLSVYDVAGREVRTLVDATMGTGMHRVSWDGCDRYGRKVGARMYLLRFTSREYTGVSRLYVLR